MPYLRQSGQARLLLAEVDLDRLLSRRQERQPCGSSCPFGRGASASYFLAVSPGLLRTVQSNRYVVLAGY